MFIYFLISTILSASIINGPYIDNISKDSACFRFTIEESTISWFGWGEDPKCDKYITPLLPKKDQVVDIYGLKSGVKYCYSIFLPLLNSTYTYLAASSTFTTFFDETKSTYSFIIYSNTFLNTKDENKRIVSIILSSHTDISFIINLGNFIKKTDTEFIYPGDFKDIALSFPIYTLNGEHEHNDKDILYHYGKMRNFSKNGFPPYYYYIDISNSRFIFLDRNLDNGSDSLKKGSKQYRWLNEVLKFSNNKKWIFIFINKPLYPFSYFEKDFDLEELFLNYKVDFVFQNGKNYIRTKKIKYGIEDDEGIFYITLGEIDENLLIENDDPIIDCNYMQKGIIKVSINDETLSLDYYDLDLKLIDKFLYSK